MSTQIRFWLASVLLLLAPLAQALDPSEVRPYEDVFAISAVAAGPDQIDVSWTIAEDYYLYNNRFLRFRSATDGVMLGEAQIPPGKKQFDELLGEDVIKFKDRLSIRIPLSSVPPGLREVALDIRSQGCLEGVLCYPPTTQQVRVTLPAGAAPLGLGQAAAPQGSILDGLFDSPAGAATPLQDSAQGSLAKDPALAPDKAFVFEAIGLDAGTVLVRFTAQPGYYLYVDKFKFRTVDAGAIAVSSVEMPQGTIKDDPEFGPVPVIYDQVEIPVHLSRPAGAAQTLMLEADFQGCRDGDICYPPQTRQVSLTLDAATTALGVTPADEAARSGSSGAGVRSGPPQTEQGKLAAMLLENPTGALLAFFVAGILLAFTPCVFPMMPILSGIIAGEGDNITTTRALTLSVVYVLAMAVTYTVAGVLAGMFGQNLQAMFQNPWIISGFVLIFILLALSMFGFYELQLPSSWQTRLAEQSNRQQGGKLGGVAVMGFLSALIVGPCVAPPLAAALIVIGNSGSPVLGGSALFAMSMGMGVPLILFGLSAGKFLPRAGMWMNAVKAVFGVGLLALAIWMLERILPGNIIMVLWGLLTIACAVYLGALERLPEGVSGWFRLWKALGVALLLFGAMQLVGAATGGDYWLKPLGHLAGGTGTTQQLKHAEFEKIKSLQDLEASVARASATGQPAMLDFYADWCVECIRMERNTFPDPGVAALMDQLQPIQADVTENDEVDQALMSRYGVIGPPAILFFDRNGKEMVDYRLVGYFAPDAFSQHLQAVLQAQ